MIRRFFLLLSFVTLFSCDKDDTNAPFTLAIPGCDVQNPLEELSWLKSEIEQRAQNPSPDMKYCYIVQGTLNNEVVFVYEDCNPLVNKFAVILNCEGASLNSDASIMPSEVKNKVIIWRTQDFACTPNL